MIMSAISSRAEGRLTEGLLRAFALLLMVYVVARWGYAWWIDPARWTALLLLVSEGYTLMLVLLARRATHRDLSLLAMVATIYAVCYVALLDPLGTSHLVPEWVGATLLLTSMALQFTAKIFLGRSFGLLPAQRGLVMVGPYRIVRHPIYFGYLIGHIGFLLTNFSWRNAAVLTLLYIAQMLRIQREEAMLAASDADYRGYQRRVRWRLLPFVY
ncbi:methyltransferase family protein [Rhodoferax ferrireducens]|uniref:methyltransferase family protein n=1 Tax=Rhodoferax ferrireducens TaxID=192843 RepID=UPI000E0CF6FC|nr:isoprenylcysteine carboxylmethyltransferase family protein [Rhodoferax ferrireducens]